MVCDDVELFFIDFLFNNFEEVIFGLGVNDFVFDVCIGSDFDFFFLGSFFVLANFKGVIESLDNDWIFGWVKNLDGSVW